MQTELTVLQKDVLKEIGNVGSGNAATAMSQLIDDPIEMSVPDVHVAAFDDIVTMVGGSERPVAAVQTLIKGNVTGKVYVILPVEEAESVLDEIIDYDGDLLNNLSPQSMTLSALHEVGNILTGSYLSALSDFTGLNMQTSVPDLAIDMAGAILANGLIDLSQWSDSAILIDTQVNGKQKRNPVQCHFLLLPDFQSFTKIFQTLGIQND